jgi:hypothetical protein
VTHTRTQIMLKKESKAIPVLIYNIEQFESHLIKISKCTKVAAQLIPDTQWRPSKLAAFSSGWRVDVSSDVGVAQ